MIARTRRLFGPVRLEAAPSLPLYVVPAGRVAILKVVRFLNVTAAPVTFDYAVGDLDDAHGLLWVAPVPARDVVIDRAEWVAHGGEALWGRCSTDGAVVVVGSGSLLVGDEPPPPY